MDQHDDGVRTDYPLGRGYGHDYMRGGEVLGGYGYSEREEYHLTRGERHHGSDSSGAGDGRAEATPGLERSQ